MAVEHHAQREQSQELRAGHRARIQMFTRRDADAEQSHDEGDGEDHHDVHPRRPVRQRVIVGLDLAERDACESHNQQGERSLRLLATDAHEDERAHADDRAAHEDFLQLGDALHERVDHAADDDRPHEERGQAVCRTDAYQGAEKASLSLCQVT